MTRSTGKSNFVPDKIYIFEKTESGREQNHHYQSGQFVEAKVKLKVQPNLESLESLEIRITGIQSRLGLVADMEIRVELLVTEES